MKKVSTTSLGKSPGGLVIKSTLSSIPLHEKKSWRESALLAPIRVDVATRKLALAMITMLIPSPEKSGRLVVKL
jgi:hypothetical protein